MTAPAVVRRWTDPRPARPDRISRNSAVSCDQSAVLRAKLARQLVRMRRVAPAGAVLFTGLVLHAGVVPHLAVRGAAPDVLLVWVVAVARARGSRAGAGFGFSAGLGADVFLATPVGTSALAYTLLGHVLGSSSRRPVSRLALGRSITLTALGVGAGRLTTALVATGLGGAAFPGAPGPLRMAGVAVLSAPLGPPAFAALQRLTGRREP